MGGGGGGGGGLGRARGGPDRAAGARRGAGGGARAGLGACGGPRAGSVECGWAATAWAGPGVRPVARLRPGPAARGFGMGFVGGLRARRPWTCLPPSESCYHQR